MINVDNFIKHNEDCEDSKREIKSTTNYDMFKIFKENRDIKHALKLKLAIQENNKLYCNPIVIDSNYFVIDGQGRLEAAKMLGVPIYYIIDYKAVLQDIITYNNKHTPWTQPDYVKFWSKSGDETYLFLDRVSNQYNISSHIIVKIFSSDKTRTQCREGTLKFTHSFEEIEDALKKAFETHEEFISLYPSYKNKKLNYIKTLWLSVFRDGLMDINILKKCMRKYPDELQPILFMNRTNAMFEILVRKVYNRGTQNKIAIFD